jgi:serine/threonine protein kinase
LQTLPGLFGYRFKEKRSERVLSLAGDLARSVLAAHTAGLCHMDIRPEAVLVVKKPERERAYLVDFELPKREMVQFGTGFWGKARSDTGYVYHPLGHKPKTMAGDIYSLGVTLLKMGLGVAFGGFGGDVAPQ